MGRNPLMKTRLISTQNNLPEPTHRKMIELLNQQLADALDLGLQAKQAHWNVKGPHFIGLHELFDKLAEGLEQARQVAAQARSQFVPNLDYNGTVSQGRNDLFGSAFPNNGVTVGSASTALNAFWEVDLWGRVRRLNESARAQFLASEAARRDLRLSLLSKVATDYFR
jgi:hypothetical protein